MLSRKIFLSIYKCFARFNFGYANITYGKPFNKSFKISGLHRDSSDLILKFVQLLLVRAVPTSVRNGEQNKAFI